MTQNTRAIWLESILSIRSSARTFTVHRSNELPPTEPDRRLQKLNVLAELHSSFVSTTEQRGIEP
jgi:hypothetical protein